MEPVNEKTATEVAKSIKSTPVCSPGTVRRSTTIVNLAVAMVRVQKQIEDPTKNKKADAGGRGSYRYADLPTVLDVVRPALGAHGFAVMQFPCELDGAPALTTQLIHESGEWIETTAQLRPVKNDPQSIGSALTYARRYALLALCGIAADDDDDGRAASAPAHRQTRESLADLVAVAIRDAKSRDELAGVWKQFERDRDAGQFPAQDVTALTAAFQAAGKRFPKPAAT